MRCVVIGEEKDDVWALFLSEGGEGKQEKDEDLH